MSSTDPSHGSDSRKTGSETSAAEQGGVDPESKQLEAAAEQPSIPDIDRAKVIRLQEARDQMSVIILGPSPEQSLRSTVQEALRHAHLHYSQLPGFLNRPGSPNTEKGRFDTEGPGDSDTDWKTQLRLFVMHNHNLKDVLHARLHPVVKHGKEIIELGLEVEAGEPSTARSNLYKGLAVDGHVCIKIFDVYSSVTEMVRGGLSPDAAMELMFPDSLEATLKHYPLPEFLDGRWSEQRLMEFFGCREESAPFATEQDPRFALVFTKPALLESYNLVIPEKQLVGECSFGVGTDTTMIRSIVVDALDILLENAADELRKEGMADRLLNLGTVGSVKLEGVMDGELLSLKVRDNAFGMAQVVIDGWGSGEQITTKTEGAEYKRLGTGQGLNQVLDIVQSQGGSTQVKTVNPEGELFVLSCSTTGAFTSEQIPQERHPFRGTEFTIKIPVVQAGKLHDGGGTFSS